MHEISSLHAGINLQHFTGLMLLVLFQTSVYSQGGITFKAFAQTPNLVDNSLYVALNSANTHDEQLPLLYRIGLEHVTYGNADSMVYYAKRIQSLPITNPQFTIGAIDMAKAQVLLGEGKYLNGLYDDALKAYLDGLSVIDETESNPVVGRLKLGLGKIYLKKRAYDKAESLFLECIASNITDALTVEANLYLGHNLLTQGNFEDAQAKYSEAERLVHKDEMPKLTLEVSLALAELAVAQKNIEKGIPLFEYVVAASLEQHFYDVYTEAVLGYGRVFRDLKNFEMAEMGLSVAYANAMQWNRLDLQKRIVNSLRLTYDKKGDFKNAYNLMTQYTVISNEIIEQQNSRVIQELEFKYQTLQKENEIYELKEEQLVKQNEIERQKTIKKAVLFGFLALLIPIMALLYVYYQKLQTQSKLNQQQEELNTQRISGLLNEQELKLARTSLDAQQEERARIAQQLHDSIGGNLAGIKLQMATMADKNELQKGIMSQINETYELVREISHDLTPKKFNESAFTILVSEYVEKIKQGSQMEITFRAHPKERINNLGEPLKVALYQIVQELFTNTIKHAKAKQVELHLTVHKNVFQLLFEDDGAGFEVAKTPNGIGLYNIKNRLQEWNGNLLIDSAVGRGTVVTIEIPIN